MCSYDLGSVVKIYFKKIKNNPHTVISNLEQEKKDEILKKLKKQFGCGGNIDEQGNILLQGNHIAKIMEKKDKYLPGMDVCKVDSV